MMVQVAKETLASRTIWWILGIMVLTCASAIGGFVTAYDKRVNMTEHAVSDHVKLPGHPVVVERVDRMGKDIIEIKQDVKTLLRRK